MQNMLKEKGIWERTFLPGFISKDHLPALYRGAAALVNPSWYEGFGLTAVEAAACGCPAIISDRGSHPEIMGQAALYVDPGNAQSIAEAMELVTKPAVKSDLVKQGLAQAAKYSWPKTAREVNKIYHSLKAAK